MSYMFSILDLTLRCKSDINDLVVITAMQGWVGGGGGVAFGNVFMTVGEEQVKATEEPKEVLRLIEEHALGGENKFFHGDRIGLTDIVFGWYAGWLPAFEKRLA